MHRLGLLVRVAGEEHERHPVARRQGALAPVPVGRGKLIELLQAREVGAVLQSPRRLAAGEGLPGGVDESPPHAALEGRLEVANAPELLATRGGAPAGVEAAAGAGGGNVLPGQRPGADRLVYALDLGEVERAAGIADEDGAWHLQGRGRLPAAGGDGAGAGRDDLAPLEQSLDARMVLVLLEGLERSEPGILVVEADDVADVHPVVVEVVEEA